LRAVDHAHLRAGPEFAEWAAKHALQIPVGSATEIHSFFHDVSDWVRASQARDQFVTRPFTPTMSLRTVTQLSAAWHEAVASALDGPQNAFPAPRFPRATVNGLDIIPIDNSGDLYREGAEMHHSVGKYTDSVSAGNYYVYSIRREAKRVATAGLVLQGGQAFLDQIRGPCNAQVPKQITAVVVRWLRSQSKATANSTQLRVPADHELDAPVGLNRGDDRGTELS